jgi:hypothetical protein
VSDGSFGVGALVGRPVAVTEIGRSRNAFTGIV